MTLIAIEWDDTAGRDGHGAVRLLDQTLLPGRRRTGPRPRRRPRRRDRRARRAWRARARGGGRDGRRRRDGRGRAGGLGRRAGAGGGRPGPPRPADRGQPRLGGRSGASADDRGRDAVLAAARRVAGEDEAANRELSRLGADWLLGRLDRPRLRVLTHCNTGALATVGWGTALGVVRGCTPATGSSWSTSTRPDRCCRARGSPPGSWRPTASPTWCRPTAPRRSTILRGLVDLAVVGADRIAANGDAANKIGTLGVALACRDAGIPFMVAAPVVDGRPVDGRRRGHRDRGAARRGGHRARRACASRRRARPASTRRSTSRRPASSTPWRPSTGSPNRARGATCGRWRRNLYERPRGADGPA